MIEKLRNCFDEMVMYKICEKRYNMFKKADFEEMALIEVKCPACGGTDISKNGKTENDIQRYIRNAKECAGKSFMIEYSYNGCKPGIDKAIIEMTSNASGIRDISRNLKISTDKVTSTSKK